MALSSFASRTAGGGGGGGGGDRRVAAGALLGDGGGVARASGEVGVARSEPRRIFISARNGSSAIESCVWAARLRTATKCLFNKVEVH